MEKIIKQFLILVCISLCTFSSWSQEVMYEGENEEVLLLSVSEFNVSKKDAVPRAIKDAYFQIMFRGIPGSKAYNHAILGTDENIMDANYQYYDNMINRGRLYSFVNYSYLSYYKKKEAVVKLTINVRALIEDLERNNLYRRFGIY